MNYLHRIITAASAAFFVASTASAQTGTVTNHAFAVGKGAGVTGYTSLLCTSAQLAVGQAAADPICRTLTGDVTIDNAGVTAIGASKVTNAQLATMVANTTKCNATGGAANPTDCTATTMRTNLALVPGTNVEAWDADLDALAALSTTGIVARTGAGTVATRTITAPAAGITVSNGDGVAGNPTLALADDLSALEGLSGTGIARRTGASAWSTGTLVTNAELATAAANTLKGNATGSTASVTDIAVPSCSGANQALNWTSGTGPGCATISGGGGTVEQMNPGGRLTLVSGTPVFTTDQAGATTIYYAPFVGKYVPIYNGSTMSLNAFTASDSDTVGLSIALGSNWAATTIYDAFVGLDSSTVRLCTGPAYTTSTAGAGARSAALAVFKGVLTNAASMTCRYNNTTTFTCAANQCTWLGAFLTNGNAGQIDFKFGSAAAGGGAAIFGVCNAYNQAPAVARVVDTTASWTSGSGNLNNGGTGSGANNRISVLSCNGATPLTTQLHGRVQTAANGATVWFTMGLNQTGLNQTSNCSRGLLIQNGAQGFDFSSVARCDEVPPLGLNYIQAMQANTGAQTIIGGALDQRLVGQWVW